MKYKVGDRVVYRAVESGNTDLDGWVGTVVGIDTTEAPYTVRFDNALYDMATDERFYKKGDPRGHDWWCKEENLSPIGVRRKESGRSKPLPYRRDDIVKKNGETCQKEGKGNDVRRNHDWTEGEDKLIREMVEAGEPLVAICDRIGVDLMCLKNHLYALRKADPAFPRCQRRGGETTTCGKNSHADDHLLLGKPLGFPCEANATLGKMMGRPRQRNEEHTENQDAEEATVNEEFDEAFEEDDGRSKPLPYPGEPKGELNDLETVMAEQIRELKDELDKANKKNAELQEWATALEADRDRYIDNNLVLERKLGEVEAERDELVTESRKTAERVKELTAQKDELAADCERLISEFEDGVRYYRNERDEALEQVSRVKVLLENAEAEAEELRTELARVNELVVNLVGRFVLA